MVSVESASAIGTGKSHTKAEANLESFLCKVDNALNLSSFDIKSWAVLGDESTCGSENWWDDDNTLATAFTACTACTDYTNYTDYTGCTGYTDYTSNAGYYTTSTQGTYATRDEHSSTEKDDGAVNTRDEIRDETEASGGLTDDDELSAVSTVVAANQLAENNNISTASNTEEEEAVPPIEMMPIVPPTAIEFDTNEGIISPATGTSNDADFSSSPAHVPLTTNPPAIEVTVAEYCKKSKWGIRVKGLRKQRHQKAS